MLLLLLFLSLLLTFYNTLSYAQMKPEPVLDPMLRKQQIARSFEMVKRVTQLVSDKGMVPQVMMNSFDPLKSFYAKMVSS